MVLDLHTRSGWRNGIILGVIAAIRQVLANINLAVRLGPLRDLLCWLQEPGCRHVE